jgi:septum formation protein
VSVLSRDTVVLASASAARAEMMERAGLAVLRDPAALDEASMKASFRAEGRDAASCATALAEAKALRVSVRHPGSFVVGADQMLVCEHGWLDKPRDLADARRQLESLRGKRHELVTAVAVARDDIVLWRLVERSFLFVRSFSDAFLDAYLGATGDEALAAVGAYQLEGLGAQLFVRIEGDYFSILGLPLLPLLDFLRGHGLVMP